MKKRSCYLAAGLALAVAIGCSGSDPNRLPLTGAVTYQGQPVVFGLIFFQAKDKTGIQGSGEIKDGVYRTNPGFGPISGHQIVRIQIFDGKPKEMSMNGNLLGPDQLVNIEIAPGTKTVDFHLPRKE